MRIAATTTTLDQTKIGRRLQGKVGERRDNYTKKKLRQLKPNWYRFRVEKVLFQTMDAVQVQINGSVYWFPRGKIELGIHPSQIGFGIDMPLWLAKSRGLTK